jgi:Tfp pilus assembly protein PilF
MRTKTRAMLLAAAGTFAGAAAAQNVPTPPAPPPAAPNRAPPIVAAPSVRAGIAAWQAGDFATAIGNWRPLADRGDADAQYNIAQAYFLGRGVPQNSNLAEQWYERAARQGHEEAQANYGLLLFQNGRRREAMPWIEQAANRGDPRAQYIYGTALYNGDLAPADLPRAYAMMSRAAAAGLPPAVSQLAAMEPHITAEDRARGTQIAAGLPAPPVQVAMAAPPRTPAVTESRPPAARPPAPTMRMRPEHPVQTAARPPAPAPRARPEHPVQTAERPAAPAPAAPMASAGGRWRIQLGAFSSEANARRAWGDVAGRLAGLRPVVVHAGAVFRLQAGPLASRAAAGQACARAHLACFPVAP